MSARFAALLLLAVPCLSSPIIQINRVAIKIKAEPNATTSGSVRPPPGANRYAAVAESTETTLQSRALDDYFAQEDLQIGAITGALAAPVAEPMDEAIFSRPARPLKALNPKYIPNPKLLRGPRTTKTSAPASTSTAARPAATTSAAPKPECTATADCAGRALPPNANAYCDQTQKKCTFRCRKNFVQNGDSCVAAASSTTTIAQTVTTIKPASSSAVAPVAVPPPVVTPPVASGCFPGSRSDIPTTPATASSLQQWWCPEQEEYAFMGFSYALYACPTQSQMTSDFKRMKSEFGARYVRLYGNCDASWHNDAWVAAAADAGLGVYGLVWFGWDNPNDWKWRMDALVKTITTNPKAPYVVRNVAVGSEPLFDWALDPDELARQINGLRQKLSAYGIKTTISEMPYGFQIHNNAPQVFAAMDFVEANVLPFFDGQATWGGNAWGVVNWSLDFFRQRAPGKQIRMTQTGWPSDTSVWKANTPTAIASVASEKAYFDLLNSKCTEFKNNGRVGWFAQIWSDSQLGGWGILGWDGKPKFAFQPRTQC